MAVFTVLEKGKTYKNSSLKEKWKCENCDKTFHKLSDKKEHIEDVHKGVKKKRCDHCGKAFKGLLCHLRKFPHHATQQQRIRYSIQGESTQNVQISIKITRSEHMNLLYIMLLASKFVTKKIEYTLYRVF